MALSVAEIAAAIVSRFDYSGDVVALPDEPLYPPSVGGTPWSVQRPFVLDVAAAASLGYRPQTTYPEAVGPICSWLVRAATGKDWRVVFPALAAYPYDLFDYRLEDAMLARLR